MEERRNSNWMRNIRINNSRIKDAMQSGETVINPQEMRQLCGRLEAVCEEKRKRKRIGFRVFLSRQMRFIGWKIWLVQSVILLFLYSIFTAVYADFFLNRYTAFFLCCLSILIMLSVVPIIYRSIRYVMYEVELASLFSMAKLLAAKLLAIGIGNIVLLCTVLFLTTVKTTLQIESALLYIILSYLTAAGGFLYLLGHIPAEKLQMGSAGLGCALFLFLMILKVFCPAFFVQTFSAGWIAVCLALFLFCIWQFRYLVCCSAYAQASI